MLMRHLWIWLALATLSFGMEPLVSVQWLAKHLHDEDLVIVDVSSNKLYRKGHIPGSVQSGIGRWRQRHGHYALVRPMAEIQKEMRRLGIDRKSRVVVYSHHSNAKDILKASYVIWAMERYGFVETAMLDGGLKAWEKAGLKLSKSPVSLRRGDVTAKDRHSIVIDRQGVQRRLGKVRMVDARPAVFYFGARKQPVLARAGHIPGATSYFWRYSFHDDGTLKSVETLKKMIVDGLGLDPKDEVITYCTGGLETSMNYFVLHRLLGFTKARLYDASMKEWANRKELPMTKYRWE